MNAPSVVLNLRMTLAVVEFITNTAPWRYGWRNDWTRSISLSCGLLAGNVAAVPVPMNCNVPIARTPSSVVALGDDRKPSGCDAPVPLMNATPSARANSVAISLASHFSTSNIASSSICCDAAGLAYKSPDAGTISVNVGEPVSGRAASNPTHPDGVPPVATSLR